MQFEQGMQCYFLQKLIFVTTYLIWTTFVPLCLKKKASSHSAIPVQKQGLVLSLPWKGNTRIQFLARFLWRELKLSWIVWFIIHQTLQNYWFGGIDCHLLFTLEVQSFHTIKLLMDQIWSYWYLVLLVLLLLKSASNHLSLNGWKVSVSWMSPGSPARK